MIRSRSRVEEEEKINSIYDKKSREDLLDDDELTPWEAAFMQGWDEAE